jgi:CRP-like cAMP-binding protein
MNISVIILIIINNFVDEIFINLNIQKKMNDIEQNELWKHLNERAKELNCLYEIDKIVGNFDIDLQSLLMKIVQVIPQGWRYPDKCKAEVFCSGHYVTSEQFSRTELKLSSSIIIDSEKIGELNMYYIKPVKSEKGIFLPEEQRLLNAVAEKIGNFIRYQKLNRMIATSEKADKTFNSKCISNTTAWLQQFHLTDDQIHQICSVPILFKKGETISKQSAITSYFLLLVDGYTKSYLESPNKSFNFMISKPHSFIGLSSLFGNNHYFSTTALTGSSLYLIDKHVFVQILAKNQSFNMAIMKWYCSSYKIIFQKLQCIANKQSIGRLADTLLYLCDDVFISNTIPGFINRKDIAGLSSISTENAVRILSDFKNDNIISITGNSIVVNNFNILRTLSLAG